MIIAAGALAAVALRSTGREPDAVRGEAGAPPTTSARSTTARPAAATAGRTLALTGSPTATLAAMATLALVAGGMLVLATRRPAES